MNNMSELHKIIDEYESKSDVKKQYLQNQCIGNELSDDYFCVIWIPEKTVEALDQAQKRNYDWMPRIDQINVRLYSYTQPDPEHNVFDHWGACADVSHVDRVDDGFSFKFEDGYEFTLDENCNITEIDEFNHMVGYDGKNIVIDFSNDEGDSLRFYYNVESMLYAPVAEKMHSQKHLK